MNEPGAGVSAGAGELGLRLVADMARITTMRSQQPGLDNARRHAELIAAGQSLADLRREELGAGDSAIVIAAGPSIHKQDPLPQLRAAGYRGAIVAADSALAYCLRQGVTPDLVVSLDPHAKRIVRWFGDPDLSEADLESDDYFRRQDLEPTFHDELRANAEVLELLNRHASGVRIALATSASESVVERVHELGMRVYWWNPMYDDPDAEGSVTRQLFRENRLPCVNAGGNVGSACWMLTHAALGKQHVALTGLDFAYYPDTPYEATQYYAAAIDMVDREDLDAFFMRVFNPHTETWFYTDPAYRWYREIFLEMIPEADCTTYNCTEGGILFGEGIEFQPLSAFLGRFAEGEPA